jgi:MSHA biogenesis protein MshQ
MNRSTTLVAMTACVALIMPASAAAAITYVASTVPTLSSSNIATISIKVPTGVTTGDVMIAMISENQSAQPPVHAFPVGWTQQLTVDTGGNLGLVIFTRVATSGDVPNSTTYTWTYDNPGVGAGAILAFRGVSTTTPVVAQGSQVTSNGISRIAPSVTPGVANTMLVNLYAVNNGNTDTYSTPAGSTQALNASTQQGSSGVLIAALYGAVSAATATGTRTITSGNSLSAASLGVSLALQAGSSSTPDHFAISHAGTAVTCQAAAVTIAAHSSAHAAVATTGTIAVSTSTGHGDWSLTSGAGSFAAGSANGGAASYTYASADNGVVVLALKDTVAETVTISVASGAVTQLSGSAIASERPTLTFAAAGFRITNGSNVASLIPMQTAGKASTQSLALQAIRTDTNTGACTTVFASGTTVAVDLAYQCNDPSTCIAGQTLGVSNNGTTTNIASNPNSGVTTYTSVPLRFSTANAEAPLSLNYSDVGQITLRARYNIPLGGGAASGNLMTGSSQFVVQPAGFALTNIKCSTYGAGTCNTLLAAPGNNPGASTATGTVFLPAGQPLAATVTAQNFLGAATPNYGKEVSPEGVALSVNIVLPVGGFATALNNASAFGSFSAGVATGTTFNWPETGIMTLTPANPDYLGSGAVTGTTTSNIGRFIPNSLGTAINTPVVGTGCSAGAFSYLGEPLTYTVAPVITVTALALGGATTRNYTGALFRLSSSSLTGRTYTPTPASPALDLSGLPASSADPAIVDLGNGQGTLTFTAGTGIRFIRGSAVAPFAANLALSINVIDQDGVTATNPVTFGAATGMAFSTSAQQFYGRLALGNAVGSELLDLPISLATQYYLNSTQGFVANTSDSCTTAPAISFSNFQLSLQAGETCVRDSGNPGASGAGCAVAAANHYFSIAAAGKFNLILAAPGSGNSGAATVTAAAPSWLQYPWNAASCPSASPCAMATFGIYPGSGTRIYQREVY